VSLSDDDVLKELKDNFVVGYQDISNKRWAGASGKHSPNEPAVYTTNGAGPHNIQIFVLDPDGVVLSCLPGYWAPKDLVSELQFAQKMYEVDTNPELNVDQKKRVYQMLQIQRSRQDINGMHARSHLQGFDLSYEAQHNPGSDFFYNGNAIDPKSGSTPPNNVKTVDVVMHERMARRPLIAYKDYDVAAYASYGKTMYDKHETFLTDDGQMVPGAKTSNEPMIGNTPAAHPIKTEVNRAGKSIFNQAWRTGLRALVRL